jgi:hypothetical protein
MRAEREKRAAVLTAEGVRQSKILTAEGEKQSAILTAEGLRQAKILTAQGEAQAISTVFQAVHDNDPDPKLLAYQYLQTLPLLAQGTGNTFWVIPSEVTSALRSVASAFGGGAETAPVPAAEPGSGGRTRRKLSAPTADGTPAIDQAIGAVPEISVGPNGAAADSSIADSSAAASAAGSGGIPDLPDAVSAMLAAAIPGTTFVDPLGSADLSGAETDVPEADPSAVNGTEAGG